MKQVFRSKGAYILAWLWVVFAALMAFDLVRRYNGAPSLVAAAVLAVLTALIYVTSMRPATVLLEDGVRVRNPLRDTFVPWVRIDDVRVSHAILIEYGEQSVRCWTPQSSARERASAARRGTGAPRRGRFQTEPVRTSGEQAALEALAGRTHADFVAQQLTERAERARRTAQFADAPAAESVPVPGTTWSWDAVAACVAAAGFVVAAIIAS
ncbi:hypothetical protein Misp01_05960 [Microtetraspora sp. NBRC 13810]|uniref:PH domain-containing protein n=1 Tax=Microtetraspora sp. NBRC 13810 TaxID=3030990 RepID=UPI0024A3DC1D|nr:PH domain-containing protein [Microtetraspora sp. NBRC 13810]GLW05466.1 hypothetical protein Misp01_05960 [Microtetraspora sp. NBRC 13810]